MADILPEGTSGNVRLEHFEVTEADAAFTRMRAAFNPGRDEYVPAGRYAKLVVNGVLMMTDTPMEHGTNREVVRHATGHVLIGGLGLGMILQVIAAKPKVTKITVIELSPDVAKLVGPYLPSKVEVVQGDIFEWKPQKGTKFDTIYHDIWPHITEENLPEMTRLHRRFSHYKAPGAWMDSWCRDTLLRRRAQRRRQRHCW
jgi:spermidine synthase